MRSMVRVLNQFPAVGPGITLGEPLVESTLLWPAKGYQIQALVQVLAFQYIKQLH